LVNLVDPNKISLIMLQKLAVLAATVTGGVSALELTHETWDTKTAGKTVFVKFLAPW
jgi:hypothetical protein